MAGDIRALYLLLARALHPDKEIDAGCRAEKTAWMQKVTVAYAGRNLAELLDIMAQNPLDAVGPYLSQAPMKTVKGFAKRLRRELILLRKQAEGIWTSLHPGIHEYLGPKGLEERKIKRHISEARIRKAFLAPDNFLHPMGRGSVTSPSITLKIRACKVDESAAGSFSARRWISFPQLPYVTVSGGTSP